MLRFPRLLMLAALVLLLPVLAAAQPAIQPTVDITQVPAAAQPSAHFDADAATDAYMNMIPAAAKARSDAYFEGGYWLVLWDFLYGAAMALVLLKFGWSAGMQRLAARITRFKWLQTFLYWVQYSLLTAVLGFPIGWYEGLYREQKYGLATQNFWQWEGDQIKGLLLSILMGGLAVVALFALVRRLTRTWWIWGAVVSFVFAVIGVAIGPVFIQPVFNTPKKLEDQRILAPILRLAHANAIPTNDVWQIDASKQTTRMSANVSGFGGTTRITLNDNLLRRGSQQEIEAVMGHEMGHYVLHHVLNSLIFIVIVVVGFFAYLRWGLELSLARWGSRWQIEGVGDPAVLPLVMLLASILFFVLTPVMNTQTRLQEGEADMFGLNAARQPDGFAQGAIHLGEYRKMHPGPIEEFLFFDHPSGYNRIHAAMVWKSQNLQLFTAAPQTPASAAPETAAR